MTVPHNFQVGDLVEPLYPNHKWGEARIVGLRESKTMKPLIVRRVKDGALGHFHADDVIKIKEVSG